MKKQFSIKGFLSVLFAAALLFSFGLQTGSMIAAAIVAVLFVVLAVLKPWLPFMGSGKTGYHVAGLSREVWSSRIEANLFRNNEFLLRSVDDSENVDYKTVHIPQSGGTPAIVINRSITGAPVNPGLRTDTEVTYDIDDYTSDPFLIKDAEKKELSYDKMDSELREMQMALNQKVADKMLYNWAPTGASLLADGATTNANILRSSGIPRNDPNAAPLSSASYLPGTTGTRLNHTMWDLFNAQTLLDNQDVPRDGRCALYSANAYRQLINDMTATQYTDFSREFDAKTGIVGKLAGFTIYVRSAVLKYDNTNGTPVVKAITAANAADDNDAVLFWYEGFMSRAVGGVTVYEQLGSPTHYGDVTSAEVRAGGAKRRKTEVGVGVIVQGVGGAGN